MRTCVTCITPTCLTTCNGDKRMADDFWKRWEKEYLMELRSFHVISQPKGRSGKVRRGDIVLLHEDHCPRHMWKKDLVEELKWGETEPPERLYSVGRTEIFWSARTRWSSPWRLTRAGRMWSNHEFISDQGSMYLSICIYLSVSTKVRWRNSLCFITKPQQRASDPPKC
jgi:hypothetical protein